MAGKGASPFLPLDVMSPLVDGERNQGYDIEYNGHCEPRYNCTRLVNLFRNLSELG